MDADSPIGSWHAGVAELLADGGDGCIGGANFGLMLVGHVKVWRALSSSDTQA